MLGIVNGTTNYILTRMTESGAGFAEALEEAQALGYAEADPTADVEGFDAAAKAAILAALAFHTRVTAADVHREGITEVTSADIASARAMGCVVKLLAIAEISDRTARSVGVRAHPAMIPRSTRWPASREAFNAVFVECEAAGELMFYGRGAGGAPTASAVLGDLVAVARHKVSGGRGPGESVVRRPAGAARWARRRRATTSASTWPTAPACSPRSRRRSPSTACRSRPSASRSTASDDAELVIVTHHATDAALSATVEALRGLDVVRDVRSASCGWRAELMTAARGAASIARVRRPAARRTRHAGRQPRRGRHAAGAAPSTCPS